MQSLIETVRRFRPETKGATAPLFALMAIPLLALAGGIVDVGRAFDVKTQVLATLDTAVLAATQAYSLDDTADVGGIISDFVEKNYTESGKNLLSLDPVIETPTISSSGEITVTAELTVPTTFLGLIGIDQFNFKISSSARAGGRKLELALVLDNTGSMNGQKIKALRKSAGKLVDRLMGVGDVKMAVVPFANYVNIGTGNRNLPGLDIPLDYTAGGKDYKFFGCMGSREHDLNVRDDFYSTGVPGIMMKKATDCRIAEMIRLTDDKDLVAGTVDGMKANGTTFIPGGLAWGWRAISDHGPFADGASYADTKVQKAIVLMTDGDNTIVRTKIDNDSTKNHLGTVYDHDHYTCNSGCSSETDSFTAELCENIMAEGIRIDTIAFQVKSGSPVQTLMKNCAGNGGQYFDAADSDELDKSFDKIAVSLLNLRLSR